MNIERRTCRAGDGVRIVYSVAGSGEPTLVFVHGGLANRGFWDAQLRAFAGRHRVLAPDLAGHGESGTDRARWGIPAFGADVRAVVDAETSGPVVLFGNSLGGPVVIEAALLLPDRVLGVVGVDTFQRLEYRMTADEVQARADEFRSDFAGSVRKMTRALFHPDADPNLVEDAERRMVRTSADAAYGIFIGMGGYDLGAAARRLTVPLWTINGDLYPTDVAAARSVAPGFQAVLMPHMGHYPMLERPDEFNARVAEVVAELIRSRPA